MKGFPPKVFIVGSQKCGTTSLASLLSQNDEICLSEPKESNYYSVNYSKGLEWYRGRYSDADKVLIDASTTYTMSPLTPEAMSYKDGREKLSGIPAKLYKDSPDAKIIYIIRDPVSRLYSNYWHNRKYGYEEKQFEDAINDDPLYIEMSRYYMQISLYMEYYKKDNILIIKFEDFIKNQKHILNICESFIGISKSSGNIQLKNENKGRQYNSLSRFIMKNKFIQSIERFLPNNIRKYLSGLITKNIPSLSEEKREELFLLFKDDQRKLIEEFNIGYL